MQDDKGTDDDDEDDDDKDDDDDDDDDDEAAETKQKHKEHEKENKKQKEKDKEKQQKKDKAKDEQENSKMNATKEKNCGKEQKERKEAVRGIADSLGCTSRCSYDNEFSTRQIRNWPDFWQENCVILQTVKHTTPPEVKRQQSEGQAQNLDPQGILNKAYES